MLLDFYVKGLFGLYDHRVLVQEHSVTLLSGANGVGKSTLLKLISAVCLPCHAILLEVPFLYLEVTCGGRTLKIEVDHEAEWEGGCRTLTYVLDGSSLEEHPTISQAPELWISLAPHLLPLSGHRFYDKRVGHILEFYEMLSLNLESLPMDVVSNLVLVPRQVQTFLNALRVISLTEDPEQLKHLFQVTQARGPWRSPAEFCCDDLRMRLYQSFSQGQEEDDDLHRRIGKFSDMMNRRFRGKEVRVMPMEGISIDQPAGPAPAEGTTHLHVDMLSPGEQQLLYLTYSLLFLGGEGTLFLIDDAERCLSAPWQRCLVDDILETVAENGHSVLATSHSPLVLDSHPELVRELPGL